MSKYDFSFKNKDEPDPLEELIEYLEQSVKLLSGFSVDEYDEGKVDAYKELLPRIRDLRK